MHDPVRFARLVRGGDGDGDGDANDVSNGNAEPAAAPTSDSAAVN